MPQLVFGASAVVSSLNRALADSTPSSSLFTSQVAQAGTTNEAQLAFAKTFGATYAAGKTPAQLAVSLLTNLGLDKAPLSLFAALTDYIGSVGTANIGIVALQLGNILAGRESDATYGTAALAWNAEVTQSYEKSTGLSLTPPPAPAPGGGGDSGPAPAPAPVVTLGTAGPDALVLAANAQNVDLLAGIDSLTINGATNAPTGSLTGGADADTLVLAAGTNLSGATVSGFENVTFAATGVYTMTAAQYNGFTGTFTAGNFETIALTTAGTIVANAAIERFHLANGTNTFTAGTNTVSVVGGNGADTLNYTATQVAGATTVDGGLGADVLNIGAIGANLNISALVTGIETINITGSAATGYTFTNENGAGVTLNYSKGATGDVVVLGTGGQTVNLFGTSATAVTVTGGSGVDTINLSATATGAETITNGSVIGNIDTVANFRVAGADVFKTGIGATTLTALTIASADTATLAASISTAATGAGATLAANTQAYIITVSAGTSAGTYAFQNIGGTVGTVDATDFIVKLTGAGSIVAGNFIA
ncbi:hypothetical protein [Acidovorax sp. A1169]|uniref:beta strand repeat-containing protein n=1 Tax=Acidovorax sp. A1169 TaxID=3059524 RepID=UPI002737D170|nr:hypothetical protein [Acidovorax sp. A1169]MDP4076144.1 hypothetical protein [Acidovorax sp. A1169]